MHYHELFALACLSELPHRSLLQLQPRCPRQLIQLLKSGRACNRSGDTRPSQQPRQRNLCRASLMTCRRHVQSTQDTLAPVI